VVTMKNAVFRDVTPCGSFKNGRYGGTYSLNHKSDRVLRLLVTTNAIPSLLIRFAQMMEALLYSET
jgi:hypothetical protein